MWRRKKLIVVAVLAIVMVFASIGGVVLADNGDDEVSPPMSLLSRIAAKLGIGEQVLKDTIAEARSEMQAERPEGRPAHGPMAQVFESFGYDQEAVQAAFEQARTEMENGTLEGERGAVMDKVLNILGIDEQDWQAACTEAGQAHQEMRGEKPEGMPFGPGFGFRGHSGGPCGMRGFDGPPDNQ
ncbi:hypothetical protein ACFLVS_04140 [Chloroflexota bacterium]